MGFEMMKTKSKTVLPLPERVIALAAAGRGVEIDSDSARALARDAIRLREAREKADAPPPSVRQNWADHAAVAVLAIAATQLIEWGLAVVAWLF